MKHSKLIFICLIILTLTMCEKDKPEYNISKIFGIFSERIEGVKLDEDSFLGISYGGRGHFVPNKDTGFVDDKNEFKEGSKSKRSTVNVGSVGDWAIWFVQNGLTASNSEVKDMSEYSSGNLRLIMPNTSTISAVSDM